MTVYHGQISTTIYNEEVYIVPGTYTFTIPDNVYQLHVVAIGGGGGTASNFFHTNGENSSFGNIVIAGGGQLGQAITSNGTSTIASGGVVIAGTGYPGGAGGFSFFGTTWGTAGAGQGGPGGGGGGGGAIYNSSAAGVFIDKVRTGGLGGGTSIYNLGSDGIGYPNNGTNGGGGGGEKGPPGTGGSGSSGASGDGGSAIFSKFGAGVGGNIESSGSIKIGGGGGGGAKAWANSIPVTPGQQYQVVVGKGGSDSSFAAYHSGAVRILWGRRRSFPSSASTSSGYTYVGGYQQFQNNATLGIPNSGYFIGFEYGDLIVAISMGTSTSIPGTPTGFTSSFVTSTDVNNILFRVSYKTFTSDMTSITSNSINGYCSVMFAVRGATVVDPSYIWQNVSANSTATIQTVSSGTVLAIGTGSFNNPYFSNSLLNSAVLRNGNSENLYGASTTVSHNASYFNSKSAGFNIEVTNNSSARSVLLVYVR